MDKILFSPFRLKVDDFEILVKKFLVAFPTEEAAIYYKRGIKKKHSQSGKSIPASGKFLSKYRNFKTNNKKINDNSSESEQSDDDETNIRSTNIDDEGKYIYSTVSLTFMCNTYRNYY